MKDLVTSNLSVQKKNQRKKTYSVTVIPVSSPMQGTSVARQVSLFPKGVTQNFNVINFSGKISWNLNYELSIIIRKYTTNLSLSIPKRIFRFQCLKVISLCYKVSPSLNKNTTTRTSIYNITHVIECFLAVTFGKAHDPHSQVCSHHFYH